MAFDNDKQFAHYEVLFKTRVFEKSLCTYYLNSKQAIFIDESHIVNP